MIHPVGEMPDVETAGEGLYQVSMKADLGNGGRVEGSGSQILEGCFLGPDKNDGVFEFIEKSIYQGKLAFP